MIVEASNDRYPADAAIPASDRSLIRSELIEAEYDATEARWSQRMVATGALIVLIFQSSWFLLAMVFGGNLDTTVICLHAFNVALAATVTLALYSRRSWVRYRWPWLAFILVLGATAGMSGIALISGRTFTFYSSLLVFAAGTGALLPWSPRWQLLFNCVAMLELIVVSGFPRDYISTMGFLIMMSSVAVAQCASLIGGRFRRKQREQMLLLQRSESHLSAAIAEHRRTEKQLEAAREDALAASRAKSEFLSSMSHEIRTPMNAILGMADLLAETGLEEQQRLFLDVMRDNGIALLSLIDDILDLAKVESGRLILEQTRFNLDELTDRIIETFALRAKGKGLELSSRIAPNVPRNLIGDPLRLRQVLVNLIGNAIKFTEHGAVRLIVEQVDGAEGTAELYFAIADTGIGIPSDKLPFLFSNFTQADSSTARRYGGSGLGLAIVERLTEMMGGHAWAESEADRGSTFHFTVRLEVDNQPAITIAASNGMAGTPILNGSTESRAFEDRSDAPSSSVPEVASNQHAAMSVVSKGTLMRVLLVDDAPDNRLLIKAFLKKSPFVIEEAENGAVAVTKFSEADYDVVLMDLQMPVVDGFEATRQMRELEAQRGAAPTPIIALTASALDTDVRRCLASGFTAHIAKPVKKALLLDTIHASARHGGGPAETSVVAAG